MRVLACLLLLSGTVFGQVYPIQATIVRCTDWSCHRPTTGRGTAVCVGQVGRKSVLLTCEHVFRDPTNGRPGRYSVQSCHVEVDGREMAARRVKGWLDPEHKCDLAVVEVDGVLPCLPLAKSSPPAGANVELRAYPLGTYRTGDLEVVSDVALNGRATSGDSGGPVIHRGEVTGIVWGHDGHHIRMTSLRHLRGAMIHETYGQIPVCPPRRSSPVNPPPLGSTVAGCDCAGGCDCDIDGLTARVDSQADSTMQLARVVASLADRNDRQDEAIAALRNEMEGWQAVPGPPGPQGPKGDPGPPGITADELADVLARLRKLEGTQYRVIVHKPDGTYDSETLNLGDDVHLRFNTK